jgi:hypothetical protein
LLGDIAVAPDRKPALHIHFVVGRRGGAALAGHLGRAEVRPTRLRATAGWFWWSMPVGSVSARRENSHWEF